MPSPPRHAHLRRRGPDRTAGVLVAIAAVALLSVLGLVWQTWAAWERQRATEARLRRNVAEIAARNFASRLRATVANDAVRLLEPVIQGRGGNGPAIDAVARAAPACACALGRYIEAAAIADSLGRVLAIAGTTTTAPVTAASIPRGAIVRATTARQPVLWYRAPGSLGVVFVLPAHAGAGVRVAALLLAPHALEEGIAAVARDSMGRLYPVALVRDSTQDAQVRVQLEHDGLPLLAGPRALAGDLRFSLPVTVDGGLVATVAVDPDLEVSTTRNPAWQVPLVSALALATLLAVLATTVLAVRSAQLARARTDFAAAVSHELRTPLTEIILFSELLERGHVHGPAVGETARLIRAEARRLHRMVENVLLVMRGTGAAFTVAPERTDLEHLLHEVANTFTPIAQLAGARVEVSAEPGLEALVDPAAMRQVLLNLLENAVRYGPEGQVIVVDAARAGELVRVDVDDRGPGIPGPERRRVFEPWARLERLAGRPASGAGLGLTVVRQLLDAMHGSIQVLDAPDGGTRMRLHLPRPAAA